MSATVCIFPNCTQGDSCLISSGPQRIRTIIAASKSRGDTLHLTLENELDNNPDLNIKCHKSCVTTYTSKQHISRSNKRHGRMEERCHSAPPIRRRRSELQSFDFRRHCLFCGGPCVPRDKKNPSRWREVVQCSTTDIPGGCA